jgi:hypothetical protein
MFADMMPIGSMWQKSVYLSKEKGDENLAKAIDRVKGPVEEFSRKLENQVSGFQGQLRPDER